MTAKQMFEYALIELNKVQAPSLLLEDYNYFINKAVNQYINKVYNMYDVNQQKSDDIRVLKSSAALDPQKKVGDLGTGLLDSTYEVDLPEDYLHILNCVVEYDTKADFKCYSKNDKVHFGAIRLTADMFSQIINNYYMRPSYKQPYYYINNVTTGVTYVTQETPDLITYPENADASIEGSKINQNVERVVPKRFGNTSKVRMEIRYGKDNKIFELSKVYVDYLKAPQFIRLTQDQVDKVQDTSQVLEFQDYVCQEIVNELVTLLLENASDPRIQTQIPINQSIANPAQEQEQPQRRR